MYNEPQTISKAQNEMNTTMSGTVTIKGFIVFFVINVLGNCFYCEKA